METDTKLYRPKCSCGKPMIPTTWQAARGLDQLMREWRCATHKSKYFYQVLTPDQRDAYDEYLQHI